MSHSSLPSQVEPHHDVRDFAEKWPLLRLHGAGATIEAHALLFQAGEVPAIAASVKRRQACCGRGRGGEAGGRLIYQGLRV